MMEAVSTAYEESKPLKRFLCRTANPDHSLKRGAKRLVAFTVTLLSTPRRSDGAHQERAVVHHALRLTRHH